MRSTWLVLALSFAGALLAACGGDDDAPPSTSTAPVTASASAGAPSPSAVASTTSTTAASGMVLTSTAFKDGGAIPRDYSCDGRGVSPPLEWAGVPAGAKGLVLFVEDPDATRGVVDHWVVYAIPTGVKGFPEGAAPARSLPGNAIEAASSSGKAGYSGPCPPSGQEHRYVFRLYAVDAALAVEPGTGKAAVQAAMKGHVLAEAQLTGRYKR